MYIEVSGSATQRPRAPSLMTSSGEGGILVCMVRAAAKMKVAAGCSPETTFNNKLPAKRQQQHSRCLGIWGNFEGALKRDRSVESQRGAV